MDSSELVTISIVLFISSILQTVSNFGFGIFAMAILPFFISFKSANVIVSILVCIPLFYGVWNVRHNFNIKMILPTIPGLILGLPIGIYFLVIMNEIILINITGIVILTVSLYIIFRNGRTIYLFQHGVWASIAAFISGFLSGIANISGPPMMIYSLFQPWDKNKIKAFTQLFFMFVYIFKLIGLLISGLITKEICFSALIVSPVVVLGSWAGTRIFEAINQEKLRKIICYVLVIMGTMLLIRK